MSQASTPPRSPPTRRSSGPGLPREYVGAWRRESIAIGDAPASEPQQVWYLQTPVIFADLRLPVAPGAGPEAFSGTARLTPGPSLTWHRDLDLHDPLAHTKPDTGTDTGHVRWSGDDLIEEGTATVFGAPVAYTEVWRRMPGDDGPRISLRPADGRPGRIVIIGNYALAVQVTPDDGPDPDNAGPHSAAWLWDPDAQSWLSRGGWPARPSPALAPPPSPVGLQALSSGARIGGWDVEFAASPTTRATQGHELREPVVPLLPFPSPHTHPSVRGQLIRTDAATPDPGG